MNFRPKHPLKVTAVRHKGSKRTPRYRRHSSVHGCSPEDTCTNVQSSTIRNIPKLETTQSIGRMAPGHPALTRETAYPLSSRMDGPTVLHSPTGRYLPVRMSQPQPRQHRWISHTHHGQEKPDKGGRVAHDPVSTTYRNRQTCSTLRCQKSGEWLLAGASGQRRVSGVMVMFSYLSWVLKKGWVDLEKKN